MLDTRRGVSRRGRLTLGAALAGLFDIDEAHEEIPDWIEQLALRIKVETGYSDREDS